jgi:hypothetical protein
MIEQGKLLVIQRMENSPQGLLWRLPLLHLSLGISLLLLIKVFSNYSGVMTSHGIITPGIKHSAWCKRKEGGYPLGCHSGECRKNLKKHKNEKVAIS